MGGGGGHYFREGSLLSGFTSSHKKLTLISGGRYYRNFAVLGKLGIDTIRRSISGVKSNSFSASCREDAVNIHSASF